MKIAVLHIVNQFRSGGIREFIMNYYRNIDRKKFEFYFLVQRDFSIPEDEEIKELGGHVVFGPVLYKNSHKYYLFLINYLKENKNIKIVHSHLNLRSLLPLYAAKKAGVEVRIAHCHKCENNETKIQVLKRKLVATAIKTVANVLCACSVNSAHYLYGDDKSVFIIKNAIDTGKFSFNSETRDTVRTQLGVKDELIIGHIGNFSPEKNHAFLIEVFEEMSKKDSKLLLVLIGEGENYEKIKRIVSDKPLICNRVMFLGTISDVSLYYNAFDAFVFPSLSEGFGMVILEAESMGLPVLVSDEIHSEACIEGLYNKISLKAPVRMWADTAYSIVGSIRSDAPTIVRQHGFDIMDNVKKLETLYMKSTSQK